MSRFVSRRDEVAPLIRSLRRHYTAVLRQDSTEAVATSILGHLTGQSRVKGFPWIDWDAMPNPPFPCAGDDPVLSLGVIELWAVDTEDVMKVREIARHFGVSRETIRRALRSGELKGERRGREWLITAAEFSAWFKKISNGYKWD